MYDIGRMTMTDIKAALRRLEAYEASHEKQKAYSRQKFRRLREKWKAEKAAEIRKTS